MAGEWAETTLADVSADVAYGYTESASDEKVGPRFLRITDIQNGVVDWNTVPYCPISESDHRKYRLHPGDIVVARTGNSTGENYLYRGNVDAVYASYLIRFRVNQRAADPAFVWYNMRTQRWQDFINSSKTGSAQAGANAKVLGLFPLTLPPLAEQRAIAAVLGALDDKIELNRRMNETLEAMARALFQSWFVDFDPVRAKLDGRQPVGMDAETAALFPDSFQDSKLGLIPSGWHVKRCSDMFTFEYGKTLKNEQRLGGTIPVYGSNGIIGWHNESVVRGPGIVVGRKGCAGVVTWAAEDFYPIDTTFWVMSQDSDVSLHYLFHALLGQNLSDICADSAVPGLNRNLAYMGVMLRPSRETVAAFTQVVERFRNLIQSNTEQSRTLATLRDTLLPKLLSGELSVTVPETLEGIE
jgi:type I restriction enzyme S subunit